MTTEPWIFIDGAFRQLIGFTDRYGRLYNEGRLKDDQVIEVEYRDDGKFKKIKFKFSEFKCVPHDEILRDYVEYIV